MAMLNTKLWLLQRGSNSDSAQKRLEMVQRIRALKDPAAVQVLMDALRDPEAAVRAEIVAALGDFEGTIALKPLIDALRDPSDAVQELAAQALKKIGSKTAVDGLVGALLRGTPGVQYHVAQALRALNWTPRTVVEQIPFFIACGDFKRVTMFGSMALGPLTSVLRSGSYERRVAAATALGELGEAAGLKPLLDTLKDPEPMVRVAVINSLASMGDKQAVPGLLLLLRDRVRNVRVAAVAALGQLGDRQAVPPLLSLAHDHDWEVRAALAEALGRLNDRTARPAVTELLQDRDAEVRQHAADALGYLGDESSMDRLILAMVDEHMGVRQAAARALASLDPYWERHPTAKSLVPQLQEAVRHREPGVQFAAVQLIRRITGRRGNELARPPGVVGSDITGDAVFDVLQILLRDSDAEVRLAAAEAVIRLNLPASIPALQSLLNDKNRWVKQTADKGLSTLMAGR